MATRNMKTVNVLLMGTGCLFGLWALAALTGGLYRVNWQVTELMRQWLVASGMVKPIHTLVDFYSHIKGIEYIICVIFFVAFPIFYTYVDRKKTHITMSIRSKKHEKP